MPKFLKQVPNSYQYKMININKEKLRNIYNQKCLTFGRIYA